MNEQRCGAQGKSEEYMTNPESTAIDPVAAMGTDHTEAPAHPLHKVLSFVRRSGRLDDRLQRAWDNYAGTYLLDIAAGNLLDVREGVTLHRAFDVCRDAHEALRTAKELGVDTILTSGQQARCADGAPLLRELVSESGEGLRILIGGRHPCARSADRCRRFSSVGEGSRAERHGVPPRGGSDGRGRTE